MVRIGQSKEAGSSPGCYWPTANFAQIAIDLQARWLQQLALVWQTIHKFIVPMKLQMQARSMVLSDLSSAGVCAVRLV